MRAYACYNTNNDIRLHSSSGGVFSLLASYVLEQSGVIYGVAMSEDCYSAIFERITNKKDLSRLRGSKYLQAKVGNTFCEVKRDLDDGKIVLFSGTGCQVNGLKCFLNKKYENLICLDVICHGTPSPGLWRKYAEFQENSYGKIVDVNFRCKDDSWGNFGIKENQQYFSKDTDPFMQMFLRDYCLRPSCYECSAKKNKNSDLTLADFWGIQSVAPEMDDGMGTSLVLVRTEKGEEVFDKIKCQLKLKHVSYEEGVKSNPSEYKSVNRPIQRSSFFIDMNQMSFDELKDKYAAPIRVLPIIRLKQQVKRMIKSVLRICSGGGINHKSNNYGVLLTFEKDE